MAYFAIFAAFKESMTLSLAQGSGHSRSYILVAIESQCRTLYRPLIVAFALSSIVSEILPALYNARSNCVSKCTNRPTCA